MEYTAFVVDLVVCEAREQEQKEEQQRKEEREKEKKRTIHLDRERLLAIMKVMKLIKRQNKRFVL